MADRRPEKGASLSFDFTAEFPPPRAAPPPEPVPEPEPVPDLPRSPAPAPKPEGPRVLSVAQLGRVVGRSLERTFSEELWVEGEVTGARPAQSGHMYFSLKDETEDATVDVVLYRSQMTPRARTLVKDGARLKVRGKPTYWAPRGRLQFVGDRVEPTGKGALLEALQQLKEKLHQEGLFAPEKKRPLPPDPRVIGVVTSAGGAVIHDICKVAFRRGHARILLAPAQVQGAGAAITIRRALKQLQQIGNVDVIIVGRGGGSQDDLLAWNDEDLVRDVAACRVPIVSAVGHETDVTLVDFAADARAATPSQAAELVVPDETARRRLLAERTSRLERAVQHRIADERVLTGKLAHTLGDPRLLIAGAQQRVDEHVARLERLVGQKLARARETSQRHAASLAAAHPRERIARDQAQLVAMQTRLGSLAFVRPRSEALVGLARRLAAHEVVAPRRTTIHGLVGRLDAMSPLKVLARGYAIVTRSGHAIRAAGEVAPGESLDVRVADGAFSVTVNRLETEQEA